MDTVDIEIPADAKMVKLALKDRAPQLTLRSLLPYIDGAVELVVEDAFMIGEFNVSKDSDLYRLKCGCGASLLHALERSRVVDGETLLDLIPKLKRVDPQTSLINGSFATLTGTGCIQLWVRPPIPDEED